MLWAAAAMGHGSLCLRLLPVFVICSNDGEEELRANEACVSGGHHVWREEGNGSC